MELSPAAVALAVGAISIVLYLTYLRGRAAGRQGDVAAHADVRRANTKTRGRPWPQYRLAQREQLTHDTLRLRFALASDDDTLGLPVGRHLLVRAVVGGQRVTRSYTPITTGSTRGYFELAIKVYEMGKLSRHLSGLA